MFFGINFLGENLLDLALLTLILRQQTLFYARIYRLC